MEITERKENCRNSKISSMEMDGAAGPTADPPHNYQANDLSDYFRHCLCDAIRYKMLLYDQVNPNQLHVTAAATAAAPAETTQAAAPAGPAPAPAVTANQAPQVQPSTEGQINMAPTLTAEQQALVAALSPETIATLLALAQAAGSLPKPAASTTSAIEPTRKPAGTAGAAEQAGEASCKLCRPTLARQRRQQRPNRRRSKRSAYSTET